jgi:hypothetical protein
VVTISVLRLVGRHDRPQEYQRLGNLLVEPSMRVKLAMAISAGGILSVHSATEAQSRRSAQPPYYYAPPSSELRDQSVCEERAQNQDPAGRYAGYPCWARESFGRQSR